MATAPAGGPFLSRASRSVCPIAIAILALLLGVWIQAVSTFEFQDIDKPGERENRRRNVELLGRICGQRVDAVNELLAGRRSLSQTAERFRELTTESPFNGVHHIRSIHPGVTDDELHYLHVLRYIKANRRELGIGDDVIDGLHLQYEVHRRNVLSLEMTDTECY